jgi:SnoaL-like domain
MTRTTGEVIDRFNRAFRERDATLLKDIMAPGCVMESVQPAPDGTRYEGYDASFSSWEALIGDTTSHFEVEDVHTGDEWALIRWRYVWGPGPGGSVRGVNVTRVVDGKIVEAAGYSKTAPIVAALES